MKSKKQTLAQRQKFLEDLELIFQAALAGKNFPAAVKAKELQGKELGFFSGETVKKIALKDLGLEGIEGLLKEIEAHPFKYIQDLPGVKKEIIALKKALEERDELKKKEQSS